MTMSASAITRATLEPALRKASSVIGVGAAHGWPTPQAYSDALAMLEACRAAQQAVPATPAPPEKPKDVAKWVAAVAEIRARETARQVIADELLLTWERATAQAGLAVAADYIARLAAHFDELVQEFDVHADAPRRLTGHESTEQTAAHTAALRAASALTSVVMERAMLADATGYEVEDIGPDPIWLVISPNADSTRDGIETALETFKHRIPTSLVEWDELRPVADLRLAQPGEVAARRQRYTDYLYVSGTQTMDLGQRGDHTFAEIENLENASRNSRIMQRETDRIFEQATPYQLETSTPQ